MGLRPCFLLVLSCVTVGVVHGANPNYSYHVKIDDAAHANYQEKAETRKGPDAVGFYSVVDPNGSLRTVEYTADDRGFNPTVTYSHAGSHVYHSHGSTAAAVGTYAPAFVQDSRVQIVDKFTGPPPALNVQPFQLPAPSSFANAGPLVVPAPVRPAPPPQLIAQAQGVEYAPAYMPPVTAFVQQQAYLPPPQVTYHQQVAQPVVQETYLPPPPPPQVTATYLPPPPPRQVTATYLPPPPPPPQEVVEVAQPVRETYLPPPRVTATYLPPPPPRVTATYLPPPPPRVTATYLPPRQEVVYEQPSPAVIAVEKPSLLVSAPKKVLQPEIVSVEKASVSLVQDSYSVAPVNTVTDYTGPTYPESIKITSANKPQHTYGPPNFTPGTPIGIVEEQPAAVTVVEKKPVKVHVSVVGPPPPPPPQVVHEHVVAQPPPPQIVQYAPQVQYVPQAQPIVQHQQVIHHQQPQQFIHHQPAAVAVPVAQKVVTAAAPLGLYAGAVGFHTGNSGPTQYLHSYGTQGFQVTSSRQFNKVLTQHAVAAPIQVQPQVQQVQEVYHHQPQQIAVPVQPAPVPVVQHHHVQPVVEQYHREVYAPKYIPPPAAPVVQVQHQHAQVAVPVVAPQPAAVYGPHHHLAQPVAAAAAVAVPVSGKKQNPLTFAYSYDQGGAKVSHSYSGSGW
ncbi:extensin-3 [Folsomia candida]|uniref:extensin-3 n=1 Tax=Folsomia candida TaxID=158441 RepID=UPI000B8EFF64|nr:extensin-3 [Folsomia candida]